MAPKTSLAATRARLLEPFGSWELDIELDTLWPQCKPVSVIAGEKSLAVYKDTYFVKILDTSAESDVYLPLSIRLRSLYHEMHMASTAGNGCAVQPIGRVFDKNAICGYIQPLGSPFAEVDTSSSKPERIAILTELVSRLHTQGIIHSDIKPDNLVFTGTPPCLKLCNFASAALENTNTPHSNSALQYISPFRASRATGTPMSTVSTIIVDFADVLFKLPAGFIPSISPKILRDIHASATWHDYERNHITEEDCYNRIGDEFKIAPSEIRAAFDQVRNSLEANYDLIKAIRKLKEELYGTLRVYAMSNVPIPDWKILRTSQSDVDWSIFDRVFTSGDAGARKPDLAFYEYVITETGIDPLATVFVDNWQDNLESWTPPKPLGFKEWYSKPRITSRTC
ncbi:hypothetical protein D9611_003805 [Ephemerocybe angulata]|uniref:Protein kinase domain-containing protein n=1 Tax=Ephemerocybe angulata TaxID=980116 RepID=A0A8H5B5T2_9AGAR|nr:hypothetical protein D9611_003805 [Tulosesus angulatus]